MLQITDTHLFGSVDRLQRGINTQASLASVLAHARNDSRWPPDAIVVTGDIVHDESRAGYRRFRQTLETLGPPAYCIPGNHDDPELMAECLASPRVQFCGDVRLGTWRVILLNTHLPGEVGGELGANELARLEGTLTRLSSEHTLICMHHSSAAHGQRLDGPGRACATPGSSCRSCIGTVRCVPCSGAMSIRPRTGSSMASGS